MSLRLSPVAAHETESLVPLLLDADEDEARIRAALQDSANTTYVALVGDTTVGAATVHWEEHESEIIYIAVTAHLRGRGYGKAIIEALFHEMRERKLHSLLVGTANSSLENIAFYQKCGFRVDSVRRDYFGYIQPPIMEHGIIVRDMLVMKYEQ